MVQLFKHIASHFFPGIEKKNNLVVLGKMNEIQVKVVLHEFIKWNSMIYLQTAMF